MKRAIKTRTKIVYAGTGGIGSMCPCCGVFSLHKKAGRILHNRILRRKLKQRLAQLRQAGGKHE